jgi:glutathione synthase/RimK-type ligase-like ATP-grasp enzyme
MAELQAAVGVDTASLPVIWDVDFLHGDDGYVLCEINASSTFAFPEHAMPGVAKAALDRIRERG